MPRIRPRGKRQQRRSRATRSRLRKGNDDTTRTSYAKNRGPGRDGSSGPNIRTRRRAAQTMDQRAPPQEDRRGVVQRRTSRSNRWNGTQTNLYTSPSRRTDVRTPRNQQDAPIDKSKVLVAKHATGRQRLCARMCRMSTKQDQYATYEGPAIAHIPHTRSYAV